MTSIQWRRFQFFDKLLFTSPEQPGHNATTNITHISAAAASSKFIILTTNSGRIRCLNREYEAWEWQAYDGEITHVALTQSRGGTIAVTCGEDNGEVNIKIWQLHLIVQSPSLSQAQSHNPHMNQSIQPLRRIPCFSSKFPAAYVTALAVLDDCTQIVIGLNNGQVIEYSGTINLSNMPAQGKGDKHGHKPGYLIKDTGSPVTALHYTHPLNQAISQSHNPTLFIVTAETVSTFFTHPPKGSPHASLIDSEAGAELGQTCYVPSINQLVVARRDGVHFYGPDAKSLSFPFDGSKKAVAWYHSYLILVTESKDAAVNQSNNQSMNQTIKDQVTVYDLKNKFIAYQGKCDPVHSVLSGLGSLFCLNVNSEPTEDSTHVLINLVEKDLTAKLEILFKKNLYQIALALAESETVNQSINESNSAVDSGLLFEIYCMYGDHLLSLGDYDGAIDQYIETIGHTEPSYVIRQFLDAARIAQLTRYLAALHERGRANSDHTTLLLNCFTKLKDLDKLEQFIHNDTWRFDVPVAIAVCRQAGYEQHALFLASKFKHHHEYVSITLEKENRVAEALQYIASCSWQEADALVREFGKKLLTEQPEQTTNLIIQLSTGWTPVARADQPAQPVVASTDRSNPDHFIHFFVDHPVQLQRYLEQMQSESQASHLVYNTLLELYLRQDAEQHSDAHASNVMAILKSYAGKYDIDHALVLCKLYKFEKGLLFLYAKMHLYAEIMQYHIDNKQHAKILGVAKKFGQHQKELWIQALTFFASQTKSEDDQTLSPHNEDEITQCLEYIERDNILTPIAVIEILSGSSEQSVVDPADPQPHKNSQPFAVVKDYLLKLLRAENAQLQHDSDAIIAYEADTKHLQQEIDRLNRGHIVFQQTKCSQCSQMLSLPSAHYLCGHSYHTKCVAEDTLTNTFVECPKCAGEFHKARQIRASMKASGFQHDKFFKQLDDAHDGFATVAEYFGRGIFQSEEDDLL